MEEMRNTKPHVPMQLKKGSGIRHEKQLVASYPCKKTDNGLYNSKTEKLDFSGKLPEYFNHNIVIRCKGGYTPDLQQPSFVLP